MKNKLYQVILVFGSIWFDALMGSSFGQGTGPGWQNNVDVGSYDQFKNQQAGKQKLEQHMQNMNKNSSVQRPSKSQLAQEVPVNEMMQSKPAEIMVGGNRATYAPSAIENYLIKVSTQLKDFAHALRQLRIDHLAIFTKYFGDKTLDEDLSDQSTEEN
jgi:hypothetical protein